MSSPPAQVGRLILLVQHRGGDPETRGWGERAQNTKRMEMQDSTKCTDFCLLPKSSVVCSQPQSTCAERPPKGAGDRELITRDPQHTAHGLVLSDLPRESLCPVF